MPKFWGFDPRPYNIRLQKLIMKRVYPVLQDGSSLSSTTPLRTSSSSTASISPQPACDTPLGNLSSAATQAVSMCNSTSSLPSDSDVPDSPLSLDSERMPTESPDEEPPRKLLRTAPKKIRVLQDLGTVYDVGRCWCDMCNLERNRNPSERDFFDM